MHMRCGAVAECEINLVYKSRTKDFPLCFIVGRVTASFFDSMVIREL